MQFLNIYVDIYNHQCTIYHHLPLSSDRGIDAEGQIVSALPITRRKLFTNTTRQHLQFSGDSEKDKVSTEWKATASPR